jgi:5'-nucleotidase/UDP-sugar diphosphatase
MSRKVSGILALIVVLCSRPCLCCAQKIYLTILHTNDTHSTLFPYGPSDGWGGIGGVSNKIKELKSKSPHALVLNSGDVFVGSFEFNKYLGYPELKIMEGLYDAMGLGNHEFDLGLEALAKILDGQFSGGPPVGLPILCANINLEAWPVLRSHVKPYLVKTVSNLRIGIVGVVETRPLDYSGQILALLSDPVLAAARTVSVLKDVEKADIVICLSHLGKTNDIEKLSRVAGIDIIVGGHSHDALFEPVISNGKIIVQAGEYGRHLGSLAVAWDGKRVKLANYRLHSIDKKVREDPALVSTLSSLRAGIVADSRFGPVYSDRIATAARNLEEKWDARRTERDTPLGNLVADGIRKAATKAGYPVDVALEANGYIAHRIYAGNVVGNDILRSVPYGYDFASGLGFKIDTVLLAGAQILAGLEYSVSMVENADDACMQVSGLTFEYDSRRRPIPPDKLLEELSRGRWGRVNPDSVKIGGKPLDLKAVYWVALTDRLHEFMTTMGLTPLSVRPTGLFEYYAVRDYMAELKRLTYTSEGRIIDLAGKTH